MNKYILNPDTLLFEKRKKKIKIPLKVQRVLLLIASAGMVVFYFWFYTSVLGLELPRTIFLKRRHAEWEAKMNVVYRQLDIYENALSGLEQRDDDVYRSYYGLSPIPDDYAQTQNFDKYTTLADLRVDNLSKRIYVRSRSLDELTAIADQAGDMQACMPAVPPILPEPGKFRLSSSFGNRTDPVRGGREYHSGIDLATSKGIPVYATGDGVIEKTKHSFRGYGNEILINHGFGYQTRYAHLNSIEVAEGTRVKRGDKIGTVGNTGKSTGPHLHYEVIYMNKKMNPWNYMDLKMPIDDYMAMINQRSDDSIKGKKSSTMEILRRGKAINEN